MRERRGFTLVELIVVVAVMAMVAALALPGLMSSQRASNERGASASLKTLASAEADFRDNDRDGNKTQDFWTADVAGLYGVVPAGETEMIRLIDSSVAGADFAAAGTSPLGVTGLAEVERDAYARPRAMAGYWFQCVRTDETGLDYRGASGDSPRRWWNPSKFAFYAFPDSFTAGRSVYFINEGNSEFKRATNGTVKPPGAVPNPSGVVLRVGPEGLVGTQPAEAWPVDNVLKLLYSKFD
jgi:prepilin-type N-terminal cleavage/methylation domain-containing protein